MPAMEPLCQILGINPGNLTKKEIQILEAKLFVKLCEGLKKVVKMKYKNYFNLMKFDNDMENMMIEAEFLRFLINDILSTEEYSITGIAQYTNIPEDVIQEVIIGSNLNPSFVFSRRILELHCTLRPSIYQAIIKKIDGNNFMHLDN